MSVERNERGKIVKTYKRYIRGKRLGNQQKKWGRYSMFIVFTHLHTPKLVHHPESDEDDIDNDCVLICQRQAA